LKKETIYQIAIILLVLLLSLLFSFSRPGEMINLKLYDIFFQAKPQPKEWDKILYVDIDDQSIDLIGQYPWPRNIMAKGVSALKDLGAGRIIIDIEYIDPSPLFLNTDYYEEIRQQKVRSLPTSTIQEKLVVNPDNELFTSFAAGNRNVYLGCRGLDDTSKKRTDIRSEENFDLIEITNLFFIPLKNKSLTNYLSVDRYMETPVYPLYRGAKDIGFTLAEKDIDGSLRKIKLFRIYEDMLVPQLSLAPLMDELGIDRDRIEIKPGNYIKFFTKENKTIQIPITRSGEMAINFTKKWAEKPFGQHIPFSMLIEYYDLKKTVEEQLPYLNSTAISAEDKETILANAKLLEEISQKLAVIKGKITITGWTAESTTDSGAITIDPLAPLVLLQGNVINTIYQQNFLTEISKEINIICLVLLAIFILLISWRVQSASKETLLSAIFIGVLIILLYAALAVFGWIFNYILILSSSIISLVVLTAFKFILYDKQKNYIRKAFMQYLSPEVVRDVIANPGLLKLGGERREITAFFSDVAGFTTISEKLTPEEVVLLLNKYLTAMTDIILSHGGTVDKYEGDAIVAFFGAPFPHPDHAARCCAAAVDMQNALIKLREQWIKEGFPPVVMRIGINTGPAIIGNMGSQQRMDYTMMGDTVNSASRFEGANKAYGTYTMISEFTYQQVKDDFLVRKLDLLRVVGKSAPIAVYELVGKKEDVSEEKLVVLNLFQIALEKYSSKNWMDASDLFYEIYKKFNDLPSKTYYDRCVQFKKNPPPPDWDGVYVLKSK
jgi:adenylate cyclase